MYLASVKKQFNYYKSLGERAIEQMLDEALFWQYNEDANSVATIIKHLHGNMLSRWTDFLTSDGEKEWRQRDAEFENDLNTREQVMTLWNEGWDCFENAINTLSDNDLATIVYIRNEGQTVMDAINRQLAHYPYHVGQIVHIAKMTAAEGWDSLSIPKNKSNSYNVDKFAKEKTMKGEWKVGM